MVSRSIGRQPHALVPGGPVLEQPVLQLVGEADEALAAGIDDDIGGGAVERVALLVELRQPRQGIGGLQQRTVAVMTRALPEIGGSRAQVDDDAMLAEQLAV